MKLRLTPGVETWLDGPCRVVGRGPYGSVVAETQNRIESERRYRVLLRQMVKGGPVPPELDTILQIAGRSRSELDRDLKAWRERARLAVRAEHVVDLLDRVAIAREGYLLVRQSTRQTRQDAEAREARARASYDALARQMEQARAADEALKALIPDEERATWVAAELRVRQSRDSLRAARLGGRNAEHLEADLETAEAQLDAARRSVLEL